MIDFRPIAFVLGVLLLIVGAIALAPPAYLVVADAVRHESAGAFVTTTAICVALGLPLVIANRNANFRLVPRQLYLLTSASWVVIGTVCALPFALSSLNLSPVDALFEAVSGVTTTGSTVLVGLESLPKSVLIWRALLQWLGGIGIIVMVIAILPHLRVGGMRLFRSEASDKSEEITARSREIAKSVGLVYLLLSVTCAACYRLVGMDTFNAVYHAMTTVSTGGYSTSDLSIRQFADSGIDIVCTAFMFLSGLPFVLLVQFLRGRRRALIDDEQVRGYVSYVVTVVVIVATWLTFAYELPISEAARIAAFNAISIITTTGYVSVDYNLWGGLAVGTFFFLTFTGACAGSTAGGIKVFRFQVAWIMLRNQFKTMLHPHGLFLARYNGKTVSEEITTSVIAFSFVFSATVAVIAVALSLTGLDLTTSLSGAATAVANVGPGLGDIIGPVGNFSQLSDTAKWILIAGMLLGRLEILTVLVLFTASFWRS